MAKKKNTHKFTRGVLSSRSCNLLSGPLKSIICYVFRRVAFKLLKLSKHLLHNLKCG
jgi:hypothetical protein